MRRSEAVPTTAPFGSVPAHGLGVRFAAEALGFHHAAAVGARDQRAKPEAAVDDFGERGDRRAARSVETGEQRPLGGDAACARGVVDRLQEAPGRVVRGAALDADGTLAGGRQHVLGRQDFRRRVGLAEALEAGHGEQRRIDLAIGELAHPGVDVAANRRDLEVGPPVEQDRLAPKRGGPDHRALRQRGQARRGGGQERIARILARQHARYVEPIGQTARNVLHGMHRDVDRSGQQGIFDFFGKQTLAAELAERPGQEPVARGLNDHDLDGVGRGKRVVGGGKPVARLVRLGECQGAASRADPQAGGHDSFL